MKSKKFTKNYNKQEILAIRIPYLPSKINFLST